MALARRELLALGAIGAAAAAGGGLFAALRLHDESGAAALLAEPFTDLQGRVIRLRDWPASALLCNFWATWCEPCREELPLLVTASQQYAAIGLQIAGIGIDQVDKLRQFVKTYEIRYPVLVATGRTPELMRALGNQASALPYSVVLDRTGRLHRRKLGAWTKADLDREIRSAIG